MARGLLIDDDQSNLEFMRQLLQIEEQVRGAIRRCLGQGRP